MALVAKLRASEPRRGKLFTAVSQILATEYSQLKHLFRRQLRFEIRMKVLAGRFGEVIDVTFLHQVVDLHCDFTFSHRIIF